MELKVEKDGNALSIITSFNYASTTLSLILIDTATNDVVAMSKLASLEDIEDDHNIINLENNMVAYIEVPRLHKGLYELQV